jgi:hypothetical protein
MVTDDEVLAELRILSKQLDDVRADYARENVKRDRRIRLHRFAIAAAFALGAVGILVGWYGRKAVNENEDARRERTIASCLQYNLDQEREVVGDVRQAHTIADALAPEPRSAEIERRVQTYLDNAEAESRKANAPRDCSPEGIRKYLSTQTSLNKEP